MIELSLSLPLDDDGFFRRACPLCCREFKVLLKEEELISLAQEGLDSYMLETQAEVTDAEDETKPVFTCPYCGQETLSDKWWTKEQLAYVGIAAQNIIAQIVNEQIIHPLKRMSRKHSFGPVTLQFQGNEMQQQEPWISPEINDMDTFDLPCCHRKIKIDEIRNSTVYCFFCGFPYELSDRLGVLFRGNE